MELKDKVILVHFHQDTTLSVPWFQSEKNESWIFRVVEDSELGLWVEMNLPRYRIQEKQGEEWTEILNPDQNYPALIPWSAIRSLVLASECPSQGKARLGFRTAPQA